MKKISDKELLMLFWTDSVVNSSKNHYKKSNFYKLEFSNFAPMFKRDRRRHGS